MSELTLESLGADVVPPTPTTPTSKLGNSGATGLSTSVEERALNLLGSGISSESVAAALGVTPARISQLLSQEDFAQRVAGIRYELLQKHNTRDGEYDSLEDMLIEKLKKSMPLMVRPDTILKAMNTVNGAKRRGQSAPEQATTNKNIVSLVLPTQIVQNFVTNVHNQVVKVGDQDLLTISSSNLLDKVTASQKERTALPASITNGANPEL